MGYRNFFNEISKNLFKELNSLETFDDFVTWVKKSDNKKMKKEADLREKYIPLYMLGVEVFEFGKYYENSKKIIETGSPLFKSDELMEKYKEYEPYVVGKEGVRAAIDYQVSLIQENFKNILEHEGKNSEKASYRFYGKSKKDVYREYIEEKSREWKEYSFGLLSINLELNKPQITESWKYEYNIFELVRLYKHTDWENNVFLYIGW